MTIRERIRYTRAIYGVTQKEVGQGLCVSKQYITQIENNKLTATDGKLEQILNMVYKLGEAKKNGMLDRVVDDLQSIRTEE